jgi:hypothetical protein
MSDGSGVKTLGDGTPWAPLREDDRAWLATEVHRLLPLLSNPRRQAWAYKLIDNLLWFWTADAVHPDGQVKRDAIKYDPRLLHHTNAALRSLTHGVSTNDEKVQHEHAGERAEIIAVLKQHATTVVEVTEILKALNFAVLVTKDEHRRLGKRSWPADWRQRKWPSHYEAQKIAINPPSRRR